MSAALDGFDHPAAHRPLLWDLQQAEPVVRRHLPCVDDPGRRALVERFVHVYAREAVPRLSLLRTSVVHHEANDCNVLVSPGPAREQEVVGLIDFGDLVHSYTVAEVAVAAAYAMLGKPDPLPAAAAVVAGYHGAFPLHEAEVDVLF